MKIAVVGSGALGSYYGAMLARDGRDVHFLLRSDYEAVRRNGIRILSAQGDFHVRPKCARTPEELGVADLVLIGLKTTANGEFARLLKPLAGPHTAFLTLQNGLGNEEALAALFPVEQVMGGLCFVSINRLEPGLIRHINYGKIILGEFRGWPEPRTHDIASMFRHAGVPCEVSDDIIGTHWQKLVWNIAFNGLGVAGVVGYENVLSGRVPEGAPLGPVLPTDVLLADPKWRALLKELMLEVIAVTVALGHKIREDYADHELKRTDSMGSYRASTLIDFEKGLPMELHSIFFFPQQEARRANVATPRLDALCAVLRGLENRSQPAAGAPRFDGASN
jgi:2-dehydropantoate 2-reductase